MNTRVTCGATRPLWAVARVPGYTLVTTLTFHRLCVPLPTVCCPFRANGGTGLDASSPSHHCVQAVMHIE
ncbi:hypothetical protein RSAG8_12906, partial [Rhizoctonia solani AG-8 WAC10335]